MIHRYKILNYCQKTWNCKQIVGAKIISIFFSNKDKASNHSAEGCRRHESGTCKNPHMSSTKYGLIIPLVVLLIGVLLLGIIHLNSRFIPIESKYFLALNQKYSKPFTLIAALILFLDWRYGRRVCYGHILEREDHIHVEDEKSRRRRIERGNILD